MDKSHMLCIHLQYIFQRKERDINSSDIQIFSFSSCVVAWQSFNRNYSPWGGGCGLTGSDIRTAIYLLTIRYTWAYVKPFALLSDDNHPKPKTRTNVGRMESYSFSYVYKRSAAQSHCCRTGAQSSYHRSATVSFHNAHTPRAITLGAD